MPIDCVHPILFAEQVLLVIQLSVVLLIAIYLGLRRLGNPWTAMLTMYRATHRFMGRAAHSLKTDSEVTTME